MVRRLFNWRRRKRIVIENDSDFNDCVRNVFRNRGYRIQHNDQLTNKDGLVLQKNDEKIYVKLMDDYCNVNNDSVKEMVISMWDCGADKGYMVVNDECRLGDESVSSNNVEIWDRLTLTTGINR